MDTALWAFPRCLYQETTFCIARLSLSVSYLEVVDFHSSCREVVCFSRKPGRSCLEDLFMWAGVAGATKTVNGGIILNLNICKPGVLCAEQHRRNKCTSHRKLQALGIEMDTDGVPSVMGLSDLTLAPQELRGEGSRQPHSSCWLRSWRARLWRASAPNLSRINGKETMTKSLQDFG